MWIRTLCTCLKVHFLLPLPVLHHFIFYYCFFPYNRAWYLIWLFPKKKIPLTLWKQAYSNILNILTIKEWKFSDKNLNISHTSGQNIDCGYSLEPPWRGSSNEYPQSMFLGRNKKNNVYPCKSQFYYIKVGFKGVKTIKAVFVLWSGLCCLQIESLDTTECFNREQRLERYFAHAEDDVNLHILHMFEGTFSFDTARFTSFYFLLFFFPIQ